MRTWTRTLTGAVAAATLAAAAPATAPVEWRPTPEDLPDRLASAADACDDLDTAQCLLPFPNDRFTVADETTGTGRRVDLSSWAMPRNAAGKPIDPTEWNRNDGFSPGALILTHVPGLDLGATFGTDADLIEEPGRSLEPDAPIVLLNAETGERHPFLAELDSHPDTAPDEALLLIRPLRNLDEASRYIVALRDLRDASGETIPAGSSFRRFRDGTPGDGNGRAGDRGRPGHFQELFATLEEAGVSREDLFLAWDFTVASAENLAGRALAMRDDAFSQLGDDVLDDLDIPERSTAPQFTIDSVETFSEGDTYRRIRGSVTVPNYLQLPQERTPRTDDPTGELEDLPPMMVPGSRLYYGTTDPGPMDTPLQNPAAPTMQADFVCNLPATVLAGDAADPAIPYLYGHGLLGSPGESNGGSTGDLRRRGYMPCATPWIGMATEDVPNVATILADMSNFPSLADRAQQGFLNFLYLGRAMIHPDGFASDEAFRVGGTSAVDTDELFYDGNSQGGIMGGALTALAPDFSKAVLGVPGMNYSTLLNRSVDWEGAYGEIAYASYAGKQEQQLLFSLIQMLWDRAEANGYAHHMTDDPYPNTPAHQVLMHVAFGDYQVANLAAEVEARTIGAARLPSDLAPGRHWAADPIFGFETFDEVLHGGSALIYFDSGNPTPPNGNVPPQHRDADPHEHPRRDDFGSDQKEIFYRTGRIVDVHDGEPYWTYACPVHPDENPGCEPAAS